MTNEILFKEIASKDVSKLVELINKGYFEISEFEEVILKVASSLVMLHQAIGEENGTQKIERKSLQENKSCSRMVS